jgi:hypothetical protein
MRKLEMLLLASLIVMALVVIAQQRANAELILREKLWVDNTVRILKIDLNVCNSLLDYYANIVNVGIQPSKLRIEQFSACDLRTFIFSRF